MGHRHSSAALSGAGAFRAPGGGTRAPAAKHRPKGLSRTARVLLAAVRAYQMFFSALMPSACKFYPSCSQYAADAVRLHGARRGSWLALRRLGRCHPFTSGGVDLVPDAAGSPRDGNATGETASLEKAGHEVHP
jgi:putative membrane protein insertion efficiency factor